MEDIVEDMDLVIKKSVAQSIMDYLVKKPYNEVVLLIGELIQLKPVDKHDSDITVG